MKPPYPSHFPLKPRLSKTVAAAFTSVKILSVIAIVAVVAAIGNAIETARKAESVSRLGGCYKAIMRYSADNSGAPPVAYRTELDNRGQTYRTWRHQWGNPVEARKVPAQSWSNEEGRRFWYGT